MTTMTPEPGFVTGGVDTHLDTHVAAAVDHVGGVLGTASFATTTSGYRQLPCRRRTWRFGRDTSTTVTSSAAKCRASAIP